MDIYRHFTGGPQRAKDNVGAWMVFCLGGTEDAFLDQLRHQRVILCQLPNLRSSDEVRATVSDMGDERLVISDDEHRQGRAHAGLTDVALDSTTGDLYASTDFGVLHLPSGSTTWVDAAAGLPPVAVYGLTIVPGTVLYAATHGRGAWSLALS